MYTTARTSKDDWIIVHARNPGLAWNHAAQGWVQHSDGVPILDFPPTYFTSEDAADEYATENNLYPRRY